MAPFNHKLKLGVEGRAKTFAVLKNSIPTEAQTFWFHCASLGEYEQGLPLFKELRKLSPNRQIVLSFFSPSGYEIRKHTEVADLVVYLPLDTPANAKRFLDLVHPELTVFVKYDIWPNYLLELKKRNLKAILISALFRKNQSYFKGYGSMMRKALSAFEHIFVQDKNSKELLSSIAINMVSIAGDTRFDRVSDQLQLNNKLPFIEEFKQDSLCVVIGSSWPEDDAILIPFINANQSKNVKYIIAPHNIKSDQIENLKEKLEPSMVLFSEKDGKQLCEYSIFVIDTIGLLTKIYSYADIAYVGGAMGTSGLHNILEPAVFGVPIVIGSHFEKFPEAHQMISKGGVVSVSNYETLKTVMHSIILDEEKRGSMGNKNAQFIKEHQGAVVHILKYIRI